MIEKERLINGFKTAVKKFNENEKLKWFIAGAIATKAISEGNEFISNIINSAQEPEYLPAIAVLKEEGMENGIPIYSQQYSGEVIGYALDGGITVVETTSTNLDEVEYVKITTIDSEGNEVDGWIESRQVKNLAVLNDEIDEFDTIYEVVGEEEVNVRSECRFGDEYIITKLQEGTQVLGHNASQMSRYNNFKWVESIWLDDNGEINTGYIAENYLKKLELSNKVKISETKKMRVNISNTGADSLKLRESYSLESEILVEMKDGTIVTVISGDEKMEDGHIWTRVQYTNPETGEVIAGWAASEYLELTNKFVKKQVNVKQGIPLRVRKEPTTQSEIQIRLDNGQVIFVDENEATINNDNHEWSRVSLDGKEFIGYVANEYLIDYEQEQIENSQIDRVKEYTTVQDSNASDEKQVLGIDISGISAENLKKLLDEGLSKKANYLGQNNQINFAIIRLGASYYGKKYETVVLSNSVDPENIAEQVIVCEEADKPYTFYYYSTCVDNEEALIEAQIIKILIETVKQSYKEKTGKNTEPTFPIFVDVEYEEGKDRQGIKRNGENTEERNERITKAKALLINELMAEYGNEEVGLYTDNRTVDVILDSDKLLKYLNNPDLPVWIQNGCMHEYQWNSQNTQNNRKKFMNDLKKKGYNIVLQQRVTDVDGVDINIMNESTYVYETDSYEQSVQNDYRLEDYIHD